MIDIERNKSARPRRSPSPLRHSPVDPFEQIAELAGRDRHHTVGRRGQMKRPRSSLLANRHMPWPSLQRILIRFRVCRGRRRHGRRKGRAAAPPGPAAPGRSCPAACRCGRSPARPGCPTGTGSPAPARLHHRRHGRGDRRRIDGTLDPDPNAAGQRDLDRARRPGCGRWLGQRSSMASTRSRPAAASGGGLAGSANRRRHLNSWLAFTSCRRATIETDAPGSRVSATS